MASPIEIEFAADKKTGFNRRQAFSMVQLRPMIIEEMDVVLSTDDDRQIAVVASEVAFGHSPRKSISDLVVSDPEKIKRS